MVRDYGPGTLSTAEFNKRTRLREERIEKLLTLVEDWDQETIVEVAKSAQRAYLDALDDKQLQEEFDSNCSNKKTKKSPTKKPPAKKLPFFAVDSVQRAENGGSPLDNSFKVEHGTPLLIVEKRGLIAVLHQLLRQDPKGEVGARELLEEFDHFVDRTGLD